MTIFILRILLFLLPFLLLYFWVRYRRELRKGDIDPNPEIEKRLIILTIIIVIAVFSGIFYLILNSETNENKNYIPPNTIDGEIEPGYFKKR
ncbi:MAG: hypothetical protein ACKVIX_03005 [Sphingomonadales bacterium]